MSTLGVTVECARCHEQLEFEVTMTARSRAEDGAIFLDVEPPVVPHECPEVTE